jgi:predicted GIY-YIG superfamily endonuclease
VNSIPHFAGVYLIHMESPVTAGRPAQHYIGWSTDVFVRLQEHRKNMGARILEVCNERGIQYHLVRVWKGQSRTFERKLKNRKNARLLCPVCSGKAARKLPLARAPKAFAMMNDGTRCPF